MSTQEEEEEAQFEERELTQSEVSAAWTREFRSGYEVNRDSVSKEQLPADYRLGSRRPTTLSCW